MKTEEINSLFAQFEKVVSEWEGIECWSARELQPLLGYNKGGDFEKVLFKAREACKQEGCNLADHLRDLTKVIDVGNGEGANQPGHRFDPPSMLSTRPERREPRTGIRPNPFSKRKSQDGATAAGYRTGHKKYYWLDGGHSPNHTGTMMELGYDRVTDRPKDGK